MLKLEQDNDRIAGLPSGQVARQVARVACRLGLSFAEVTDAVTGALRTQE